MSERVGWWGRLGACGALCLGAGVAAAGPEGVQFVDGFWEVTGSSFFDPDTSMDGDEVDESAAASDGIAPGSVGSVGGGGTSSGPFAARFDWSFNLMGARVAGYPWTIDLLLTKTTCGLDAPGVDGFASLSMNVDTPIIFQVFDIDGLNTPVRFELVDAIGNVSLSVVSGEPGGINGDMLLPGIYQLDLGSNFFSASHADGVQDGTMTEMTLVDFRLRIVPSPGVAALLAAGGAVALRRRRG